MSSSESDAPAVTGLRYIFRALRHRNYRLFFFGQGTSVIGTWMQGSAQGWLIPILAKRENVSSDFWLGVVPFVGQLPAMLLPLFAGVLADRFSRRRIMLITQSTAMLQSACLGILAYTNVVSIWQLIILALVMGLVNSFDIPARQSFVVDMIDDRSDLSGAIALNSSLVNMARLIGPPVAGFIIAYLERVYSQSGAPSMSSRPMSVCFFINSLSYLAVIIALLSMRVPPQKPRVRRHVLHELAEGFRYVSSSVPIRSVLMLIALCSFMGVTYGVVMPNVARNELAPSAEAWGLQQSQVYGMLLGCAGLGALFGVGYLASRRSVRGLKNVIAFGAFVFGFSLVLFSLSNTLWLSLPLMMAVGFGMMTTTATSNTFLQGIVEDDKRGRMMSFWTMSFMGMVPMGSLFTGSMAHWIGRMNTLALGGTACIIGSVIFATRLPKLRRLTEEIYNRRELALQAAPAGNVPRVPPPQATDGGGEPELPPVVPPEK